MASETVTVIQGKKAIPPNLGIWAVCNLRSSTESNRRRRKEEHKAGKDPILRKATALLLIHTPKSNRFGSEDANLAYQNASLMAQSLGVSQIYMGFVLTAIRQEGKDTLAKTLGIDGKIQAIMALGIPAFKYPKYTDRKEIVKNYIE